MNAMLVRRILARAERDDETGCLLWMGAANRKGYGRIRFNKKLYSPHRVVLEHKLGRPLKPGEDTCHLCHNPRCVEAKHLSVGSRSDNMRQAVAAGRFGPSTIISEDGRRRVGESNRRRQQGQCPDCGAFLSDGECARCMRARATLAERNRRTYGGCT